MLVCASNDGARSQHANLKPDTDDTTAQPAITAMLAQPHVLHKWQLDHASSHAQIAQLCGICSTAASPDF